MFKFAIMNPSRISLLRSFIEAQLKNEQISHVSIERYKQEIEAALVELWAIIWESRTTGRDVQFFMDEVTEMELIRMRIVEYLKSR